MAVDGYGRRVKEDGEGREVWRDEKEVETWTRTGVYRTRRG